MDSSYSIYSASAGSGKTYALTRQYLLHLFSTNNNGYFRQLLAITFTNKAVAEMKERILGSLHQFATTESSHHPMLLEISKELNTPVEKIKTRSAALLKEILHNYAFFEVSTIDHFTHRIIRTFAREMELAQGFEVVLDNEPLLKAAIDRVLNRAGIDQNLTPFLIEFALEKIDEDKNWKITEDLLKIGKLLFDENHNPHLENLESKSLEDFSSLKTDLRKKITEKISTIKKQAETVLAEIEKQGFEHNDFLRNTLPNHFSMIATGVFLPKRIYGNTLETTLREGSVLKTDVQKSIGNLQQFCLENFLAIKEHIYKLLFIKNAYNTILSLSLLNEIGKEIKALEKEDNIVPMASFNKKVANEIREQPAPFIYERLGEKYQHFFIDEFQDTSKLQWKNLIPLIANSLESENEKGEKGSLLLVGDIKQAIYRWRGGDINQFLNLLNGSDSPFSVPSNLKSLETNWRSHDTIIEFNNSFFSSVAQSFESADFENIYLEGSRQKKSEKKKGLVQLDFLSTDNLDKEKAYNQKVLEHITNAVAQGHRYQDICILLRDNKKTAVLATYLAEQGIPLTSPDSLLLKNNPEVSFLISFLYVLADASNQTELFNVLYYISDKTESDKDGFIRENLKNYGSLLQKDYKLNIARCKTQSVYDIVETAIASFQLAENSETYLIHFLDEILAAEQKENHSISAFLRYWESKKEKLAIPQPQNMDAVQLMTIHKSKGLEFPIVIFPHATTLLNDNRLHKKIWVPVNEIEFSNFNELLLDSKSEMLEYEETVSQKYIEEVSYTQLDAINVLYVALTRAVKALYIITDRNEKNKSGEIKSYPDLFRDYLSKKELWDADKTSYSFGCLTPYNEASTSNSWSPLQYRYSISKHQSLNQLVHKKEKGISEALDKGNLIHDILSKVRTSNDIQPAVQNALPNLSDDGERRKLLHTITTILEHPQLAQFFQEDAEVLNEKEILLPHGGAIRPDRLVITDNKVSILDYKTGAPHDSHKDQINSYGETMKALGYEVENKVLVYIAKDVKPIYL